MKTIKKISLVLFTAIAISLSSCSSDSDGGGGGSAGAGTITAKVNGNTVTSLAMTTYAEIQLMQKYKEIQGEHRVRF